MPDLDDLLDTIDALEAEEPDDFPWTDSWSWSPNPNPEDDFDDFDDDFDGDYDCIPPADNPPVDLVLTARLADGRCARWSAAEGWTGDECVIAAAQGVAAVYAHMGEMTAAASGLIGVSVDGRVCESTWLAARL